MITSLTHSFNEATSHLVTVCAHPNADVMVGMLQELKDAADAFSAKLAGEIEKVSAIAAQGRPVNPGSKPAHDAPGVGGGR